MSFMPIPLPMDPPIPIGFEIAENGKNNINAKINDKVENGEIPRIIQKQDIVVVPSFVGEALGKVAIEARAAGKIVVASDVGGLPEVVEKNKGFTFEPGDYKELSSILKKLIKKEIKIDRVRVRQNLKKFSLVQIVKEIRKVYSSLAH
jgi:glycosyltransferase involved in cell wall biosynthesis